MRIGMFLGPFAAAAAIHRYGLVGAYGVGIAALLLSGIVAARMPDVRSEPAAVDPAGTARNAPTILSTLRDQRQVFATLGLGIVLVSVVRTTCQTIMPLWADHLALDPAVTSLIYGLAGGIDMLLFYSPGKVMDHMGRRWVVVPSLLIMSAGLLAVPWTWDATSLLIAAMAIGFGNGIGSGMMMTLGADHSPRHGRAHFLAAWRLMSDVGGTCGPGMVSLLAATMTLAIGIAVTGLLAFVAAGQLTYWIPRVVSRVRDACR